MKKIKSQKQLQLGENYKRAMSQIFIEDDLLHFKDCHITILEADISADLKNIKFYLDIFASEDLRSKVINHLNNLQSYLRKKITNKVKSRVVPDLRFVIDDSATKAVRIDELLKKETIKNCDDQPE